MSIQLPAHDCDLVMRGGIASGIAYPEAIAELATKYRFRCIGGTSAGAIAATIAAAAEYGRQRGRADSFDLLRRHGASLGDRVADGAGTKARIVSLFAAPPETRLLLHMMLAWSGSDWAMQQLDGPTRLLLRTLRGGPGLADRLKDLGGTPAVGAAVALFVPASVITAITVAGGPVGALIGLALLGGGLSVPAWAAASVGARVKKAADALAGNFLGISTGMRPAGSTEEGLTEWMHRVIQECAGRTPDDTPVTFADLQHEGIKLQLITTNLTRGRSARLPDLEDAARGIERVRGRLYFNADQLRRLLPERVVQHMIRHEGGSVQPPPDPPDPDFDPRDAHDRRLAPRGSGLFRLPDPADLPIVLAARMSLSFPVLLAQVPLWAPDPMDDPMSPRSLRQCWFTDGGITSNFPISIFDGPLPRWPTFGINLIPLMRTGSEPADRPDLRGRVRMPLDENEYVVTQLFDPVRDRDDRGLPETQARSGLAQLLAYLGAVNDTARNWAETELVTMPGYRDRIVAIELSKTEGGLNLDMPQSVVDAVRRRGLLAGRTLLARFHPDGAGPGEPDPITGEPPRPAWAHHRWTRLRSFLAAYEELGRKFVRGWKHPPDGREGTFGEMLANGPPDGSRYLWDDAQQAWAQRTAPGLVSALEQAFPAGKGNDDPRLRGESFDRGDGTDDDPIEAGQGRSPRPKMALRATAPRGSDPADAFTPLDPDSSAAPARYAGGSPPVGG
jgi:predicted acylesterase/phospholipase RssA